jgi:hypothetical protein
MSHEVTGEASAGVEVSITDQDEETGEISGKEKNRGKT